MDDHNFQGSYSIHLYIDVLAYTLHVAIGASKLYISSIKRHALFPVLFDFIRLPLIPQPKARNMAIGNARNSYCGATVGLRLNRSSCGSATWCSVKARFIVAMKVLNSSQASIVMDLARDLISSPTLEGERLVLSASYLKVLRAHVSDYSLIA